jgi:hypothetical protein
LLRRIARGFRAGMPFPNAATRERYVSYEQDLAKFQFRQSGRVEVQLKDGSILRGECRVPPGFAGDPERKNRVEQKFMREAAPVCGKPVAEEVMKKIYSLPDSCIGTILPALCRKNDSLKKESGP